MKNTKKGMAARARAFADKARRVGKNVAKKKGMRRVLDAALSSNAMAIIPGGHQVQAAYRAAKSVSRAVASPCLKKWFDCLTDPFGVNSQGSCIPSGNNLSSMRYYQYARGDIAIGTAGVGFLLLTPTPTNDCVAGWLTTATFAGSDATVLTANGVPVGGLGLVVMANSRFASTALQGANPTVSTRIVGGGVRLYYTGTELNLGGLMSVYTNPTHDTVQRTAGGVAMTSFQLGNYQETVIKPVSREPFEYPLSPLLETELSYPPNASYDASAQLAIQNVCYPWSQGQYTYDSFVKTTGTGGLVDIGVPTTIVMVTGTPGNTIHFEYGLHIEAVGDATEGMRQPAESDVQGVNHVMAALSRMQIDRNSHPNQTSAQLLRKLYGDVVNMSQMKVPI